MQSRSGRVCLWVRSQVVCHLVLELAVVVPHLSPFFEAHSTLQQQKLEQKLCPDFATVLGVAVEQVGRNTRHEMHYGQQLLIMFIL